MDSTPPDFDLARGPPRRSRQLLVSGAEIFQGEFCQKELAEMFFVIKKTGFACFLD
jgi:hypothetical protein